MAGESVDRSHWLPVRLSRSIAGTESRFSVELQVALGKNVGVAIVTRPVENGSGKETWYLRHDKQKAT